MVSSEQLRRYPFFGGLSHDHIEDLAKIAHEEVAEPGDAFFREGETLKHLRIVTEGSVDIVLNIPDRSQEQVVSEQLMGNYVGKDVTVSTVGPGEVFAWSAVIPPNVSTASAIAATRCRLLSIDCDELSQLIASDGQLGTIMMQKVANVVRQRLRDMQVQSLSSIPT